MILTGAKANYATMQTGAFYKDKKYYTINTRNIGFILTLFWVGELAGGSNLPPSPHPVGFPLITQKW